MTSADCYLNIFVRKMRDPFIQKFVESIMALDIYDYFASDGTITS